MNGRTDLLLDTNAVISLLRNESEIRELVSSSTSIALSVITVVEFRVGLHGVDQHSSGFAEFLKQVIVLSLDAADISLMDGIVRLRQDAGLKFPDAVIAASTIKLSATLVTRDRHFDRVADLSVLGF